MATEIKLSPQELRERANDFRNERDAMERSIGQMEKLIGSLENTWKGKASEGYAMRFRKLKPAFANAKDLMDELSHNLNESARILEETDQQIASKLQ